MTWSLLSGSRAGSGTVPQEQRRGAGCDGADGADELPLFGSSLKDDRWSTGEIDWRIGALS